MSIGPFNAIASAAGSPLAQTRGADHERTGVDREQSLSQERVEQGDRGDAEVEENHASGDRDADGRDLTRGPIPLDSAAPDAEGNELESENAEHRGRDARGELGSRLDIDG